MISKESDTSALFVLTSISVKSVKGLCNIFIPSWKSEQLNKLRSKLLLLSRIRRITLRSMGSRFLLSLDLKIWLTEECLSCPIWVAINLSKDVNQDVNLIQDAISSRTCFKVNSKTLLSNIVKSKNKKRKRKSLQKRKRWKRRRWKKVKLTRRKFWRTPNTFLNMDSILTSATAGPGPIPKWKRKSFLKHALLPQAFWNRNDLIHSIWIQISCSYHHH